MVDVAVPLRGSQGPGNVCQCAGRQRADRKGGDLIATSSPTLALYHIANKTK